MSAASASAPAPAAASAAVTAAVLPPDHEKITEGKASIIFSKKNRGTFHVSTAPSSPQPLICIVLAAVFYNKVQCFNRDMSILAIRTFIALRKAEFIAKGKPSTHPSLDRCFISLFLL
jgi:hypothetical protein